MILITTNGADIIWWPFADGRAVPGAAECACGTGSLTVRLAQSGMAMTGVDLSAAMLRQAEKKARDYGVEAAFVRQDMKKLTLPRRVGAVLATCDGVNYLTTPEDVRAFFSAAYRNLLPGGALCLIARPGISWRTSWATLFS